MNTNDDPRNSLLAAKIEEAEERIEKLEVEIEEIGQPAASELKRRLEALKVEERALKRNLAEALEGKGDHDSRMAKIEALLRHIEREESSVEHEAAFLHQGNPSTVVMAAEAGAKVIGAIARGVKRVVGDHPFETSSVFVNHSHETLVSRYGLKKEGTIRSEEG
jgi:DNA repair exonuclease SbcCD ATPase subunit